MKGQADVVTVLVIVLLVLLILLIAGEVNLGD